MARSRAPHRGGAGGRPRGPAGRVRSWSRWLSIVVVAAVAALSVFAFGRASVGGGSPPSVPSPRSAIPGVGPTRTVHGVPGGYAHTRAGALAAALNYIGVVGNPAVLLDVRRLRRVLSVVATTRLTRRVLAGYGQAAARLGQSPLVRGLRSGAPAIAMVVPLAYRVVRTTADRLTAQFWTVGVVGEGRSRSMGSRSMPTRGAMRRGTTSRSRARSSRRPRPSMRQGTSSSRGHLDVDQTARKWSTTTSLPSPS
jgi:hypothetical protein